MNTSFTFEAPPTQPTSTSPLPKVVLDEFEFDRARLRSKHINQLQELAARIAHSHQQSAQPVIQIVVVGHTDKQGTGAYNWGLGFRRAITAADNLRRILEQRYNRQLKEPLSMRAETEGEFAPASGNHAKNRRVEIHLLTQRIRRQAPPSFGPPPNVPPPFPRPAGQARYELLDETGDEITDTEFLQGDGEAYDMETTGESRACCKACGQQGQQGEEDREILWEDEATRSSSTQYVRAFSSSDAECVDALSKAGKTRAEALAIINTQIGSAIRMLRVAARKLRRGNRSTQTRALFRRIFRVTPEFVPTWLKQTPTIRDRGDVVAVRCRSVADSLASGKIQYFCTINSRNCPDCGNDNSAYACSSWGKNNVVCLGAPFWDFMKNGHTASMLSTLMHEPFHIYYGTYVTEHGTTSSNTHPDGRSVGKFGGIYCNIQFVFQINRQTPTQNDINWCSGTGVRSTATGF